MNKGNISEAFNSIREMHKKPLKESHRRRLHEDKPFINGPLEYDRDIVSKIEDAYDTLRKDDDTSVTHAIKIPSVDDKNEWAICLSYMDYDDNGDWRIYGKLAYKPKNSHMSDYDVDWMMPYNEKTGEVWDTEEVIDDWGDLSWAISKWSRDWGNIETEIVYGFNGEDDADYDFYDVTMNEYDRMSESYRGRRYRHRSNR